MQKAATAPAFHSDEGQQAFLQGIAVGEARGSGDLLAPAPHAVAAPDRPDDLGAALLRAVDRYARVSMVDAGARPWVSEPEAGEPVRTYSEYLNDAVAKANALYDATRELTDLVHRLAYEQARSEGERILVHIAHDRTVAPEMRSFPERDQRKLLADVEKAARDLDTALGRMTWAAPFRERFDHRSRHGRAYGQVRTTLRLCGMSTAYAHMAVAACQPDPDGRQSQGLVRDFLKGRWTFEPGRTDHLYVTLMEYIGAAVEAGAVRCMEAAERPEKDQRHWDAAVSTLRRRAANRRAVLEVQGAIADDPVATPGFTERRADGPAELRSDPFEAGLPAPALALQ